MKLDRLKQLPSEFDFYQAVYCLERQFGNEQKRWQGVGRDGFPKRELVRFKSVQHLGFPGQPISKIESRPASEDGEAVAMHVSFMGLTGPSGVLPQHYTELVLQRLKQRDKSMRDFYDLFNHRLVSLYYRAWEKYRFACQYEIAEQNNDSFSTVLTTLSGAENSLGLYYAGAFSKSNRSAQQLRQIITDLLGANVQIEPLQGRWLTLAPAEQTRLGQRIMPEGQHSALGVSAMLGQRVWHVSSAIELVITASENTAELLPGTNKHRLLQNIIADYLAPDIQVRVTLNGRYCDFPAAQLSSAQTCLGRSGRLGVRTSTQHQGTRLSYKLARL